MDESKHGKITRKNSFKKHGLSEVDQRHLDDITQRASKALASYIEEQDAAKALIEAGDYNRKEPYRMMKKAIEESLNSTDRRVKATPDKRIILVLSEDGLLYLQNRSTLKVDFSKAWLQRKLLSVLKSQYVTTAKLIRSTGAKSEDSFYKAKEEINRKCQNGLKLKTELILSQRGSYRLDPMYQLILSDT